jgi:23S rRNA pseudouridine1911/1915/1917 synthase
VESSFPTVAAVVRERTGLSWSRARKLCAEGRVTVDGARCLDPARRIDEGSIVAIDEHGPKMDRGPLAREALVHCDRDLVVVDKPPGMLTVDYEGSKDTLAEHARLLVRRADRNARDSGLGVVHRLDRDTSGLVVFTRTADAKRVLAAQFRAHDIERAYRAIAHEDVAAARIESDLVDDRGDGLRGSWGHYRRARATPPSGAKRSITNVTPIASLAGATLVECRLETGRQHQIRIHLAEAGHPILGEAVYIRDYPGPKIDAPRVMLHARTLGFRHPRDGKPMSFERDTPPDFQAVLDGLSR